VIEADGACSRASTSLPHFLPLYRALPSPYGGPASSFFCSVEFGSSSRVPPLPDEFFFPPLGSFGFRFEILPDHPRTYAGVNFLMRFYLAWVLGGGHFPPLPAPSPLHRFQIIVERLIFFPFRPEGAEDANYIS